MPAEKIHRRPAVLELTGLSTSTLYAMMAEGTFPKPLKLGARAVGWRESDLAGWQQERANRGACKST
jgi:prophage regulatory protein